MNPFLRIKEQNKLSTENAKRMKVNAVQTVQTVQAVPSVQTVQAVPNIIPMAPMTLMAPMAALEPIQETILQETCIPKPLYLDPILKKLDEYIQGPVPTKILVFEGHPGIGKSYALEYYAQQHNYTIDIYDDDTDLQEFICNDNLNQQKRLLVIDYVESLELTSIHKHLQQLINKRAILTTLNVYESNIYKWKTQIEIVRFKSYTNKELATILGTTDQKLLEQCKGDLRYAQIMQRYTSYANQDTYYDLFGTTRNGIMHSNVSGVQSKDLFLLLTMLQQNSASWSLNLTKSLDAFCNIDLQERELPSENLCDYLNCILEAFSCKKVSTITMPKVPNTVKMSRCLRLAVPNATNRLDQHDTLNCLRLLMPPKITKNSEYYHENADVRQLFKASSFKI